MKDRISIDALAGTVSEVLSEYAFLASSTVQSIIHEVAVETAEDVSSHAPSRTGKYASSWTSGYAKSRGNKSSETVYASFPGSRISHLLEHGHAKVNGGRVAAIPHIATAEKNAEENIVKKIKDAL